MGRPVIAIIQERTAPTIELMLTSLFLSLAIAIVLGVIAAVKQYSIVDNLCTVLALFGYSMPTFWIGLMLILFLGVWLNLFPIYGATSIPPPTTPIEYLIDHVWHLTLPVIVTSTLFTAYFFRLVKRAMLDVLSQDYITMARAKGVRERIVIYKHALRNALLPVVTYTGMAAGFMLSGAVVVETLFAWPGLGKLAVDFALQRDYPSLLSLSMIIVIMVYIANLITDIAYAYVDPRIRY